MGCGVGRFQELICLCRLPVELQAFAANPSVLNEDDIREQSESDQRALRDYLENIQRAIRALKSESYSRSL